MTDSRSYEYAHDRCSLSRAVDLDLDALDGSQRAELEYEGRAEGWIDGSMTTKSLRKSRIMPMEPEVQSRLMEIRGEAGHAFDKGADDLRAIACYAWHYTVTQYDIWPMYARTWRPFEDRAIDMTQEGELQYGEFIYDTWLSVYELERYFYNWALRAYYWLEAGLSPDVKRWETHKSANGGYEGDYVTAHRAATFVGGEPMPTHFREKLTEPTAWIRHDVKGGANSWKWPHSWMSIVVDGERQWVPDLHVSRYAFSWHELLIRFEELGNVRRRAEAFGASDVTKDGRSCANKLAYRAKWFMERFGPWYGYAKAMWLYEGQAERRFML